VVGADVVVAGRRRSLMKERARSSTTRPGRCSSTSRRLSLNLGYKLRECMMISGGVLHLSNVIQITPETGELLQNKP